MPEWTPYARRVARCPSSIVVEARRALLEGHRRARRANARTEPASRAGATLSTALIRGVEAHGAWRARRTACVGGIRAERALEASDRAFEAGIRASRASVRTRAHTVVVSAMNASTGAMELQGAPLARRGHSIRLCVSNRTRGARMAAKSALETRRAVCALLEDGATNCVLDALKCLV